MAERLAIDGGTPILTRNGLPELAGHYRRRPAVRQRGAGQRDCGWRDGAPGRRRWRRNGGEFTGAKYCLTTGSGTAALHMALAAVDVGPGDEVLVPSYTFLATASCVLHQMAIPVFVDIDPATYTMDPTRIEAAITPRTKAIIPVHIQGCPADMDPILEIAQQHNLHVIEDACQAHGAMYKGRMCGTLGIAGAFSLNNLKNLCGGEGGLFVTNDEDVLRKGDLVRYFGDECDEATRRQKYNASILGYMYRNQELPAALARGQLKHLNELNATRIRNAEYLTRELGEDSGRDSARLPARLQARVLVLRGAVRSAGGGSRRRSAAVPRGRREGVVRGRGARRAVADHARAGPGRVPEHDRDRQAVSVGDQRGPGHLLPVRSAPISRWRRCSATRTPTCTPSIRPTAAS